MTQLRPHCISSQSWCLLCTLLEHFDSWRISVHSSYIRISEAQTCSRSYFWKLLLWSLTPKGAVQTSLLLPSHWFPSQWHNEVFFFFLYVAITFYSSINHTLLNLSVTSKHACLVDKSVNSSWCMPTIYYLSVCPILHHVLRISVKWDTSLCRWSFQQMCC